MTTNWNTVSDDVLGYAYAYSNYNWVSYDDVKTVKAKVSLYSHTSHTPLTCFEVCTERSKGSFKHSDESRIWENFTKQTSNVCLSEKIEVY